jgi:hypothetical protein
MVVSQSNSIYNFIFCFIDLPFQMYIKLPLSKTGVVAALNLAFEHRGTTHLKGGVLETANFN